MEVAKKAPVAIHDLARKRQEEAEGVAILIELSHVRGDIGSESIRRRLGEICVVLGGARSHAALDVIAQASLQRQLSEGLSDTGEETGRGNPFVRGGITGGGTFLGGVFHTLPFLISSYSVAIVEAVIVVAVELVVLAALRSIFFRTSFTSSFVSVTLGGAIIATVSSALGVAAG